MKDRLETVTLKDIHEAIRVLDALVEAIRRLLKHLGEMLTVKEALEQKR